MINYARVINPNHHGDHNNCSKRIKTRNKIQPASHYFNNNNNIINEKNTKSKKRAFSSIDYIGPSYQLKSETEAR